MPRAIHWAVRLPACRLVLVLAALCCAAGAAEARPRAQDHRVAQADGAVVDAALTRVRAAEAQRGRLLAERGTLARRYQAELAQVDKLKRQKASWRRDRQLRDQLSASLETAKRLGTTSSAITVLDGQLARQRRALIVAIDAELAAGATDARARTLRIARADAAAKVAPRKAKKIVLPDDEIDPLADPDELEQQAQALRDSEAELSRQIASLDRQAARFRKQAELRKAHARADELATRDDTSPRRTSGSGGGRFDGAGGSPESSPPPSDDSGGGPAPPTDPGTGGSFEGDPALVLSDVVDGATVDALRKAERSTDPGAKAAAADRARAAVARRLEKLKARRKEIEKRAKDLRE